MTNSITPRDWEAISAYLDGELNKKERVRLEQRLQSNTELRRAAEDLSRMRSMLRSQPKIKAPRNFTLTPAMAGVKPRPAPRGYPFLRLASAVASLLFVMVLASDLLIGSSRYAPSPAQQPAPEISAIAPMAAPVLKEAQGEGTAVAEQPFEQGRSALAPQGTAVAAQGLAPTATPEAQALMAPNLGAAALPTGTAAADASAMSVQEAPLPPDEPMLDQSPEPALEAQQQAYQEQTDTGGAPGSALAWRLAEGLLVLIAVATGIGAYLLRKAQ